MAGEDGNIRHQVGGGIEEESNERNALMGVGISQSDRNHVQGKLPLNLQG